jgi:glycosyltransferase involved in cell wall biosynthesis
MRTAPTILVNHLLEPSVKITGITRYTFSLLEELISDQSFRFVLATTWPREKLPKKLRSSSIVCHTRSHIESTPLNIAAQMAAVPLLMRKNRAVLEFNCNPIGCFWPLWPRVITVHDLYFELMPHNFPRRHRMWWHLIFPKALSAASAIVCVSEASRQHLKRLYPRFAHKAVVIHEAAALKDCVPNNGTTLDTPIAKLERPYALYVGNISPNKCPETLIAALRLLEQTGIFISVYHVGRDELGLLGEAQRRTPLRRPVCSVGVISDTVLAALYRGAHCFVNTSLDEGFCLPILEAQSRGVPIVCSDIPVLREIAGEGALFFNPTDPAALADSLSNVFANAQLHSDIAARGRLNAALFSWKRSAADMQTIFRNVLS